VQEAFIEASAFQCGYCTPGFIMMVTQLLDENPDPTDDQIKHYLTGNLCRCATYPEVMDAVKLAAKNARPARRPDNGECFHCEERVARRSNLHHTGAGATLRAELRSGGLATALRLENPLHRGWKLRELCSGPNGTRREIATAIGAAAAELAVHAVTAECAFKRANHGVRRRRRQIFVTAFAVGSQLKHDVSPLLR
jgi:hypothetical protein